MKTRKWSLILITAALCSGFAVEEAWVVGTDSRLSIQGTTNINTFTCEVNSYQGKDTLWYFRDNTANELRFSENSMTIPVSNFNCGPAQISKDFLATLKSDRYPQLAIHFISLETTALKSNSCVAGTVDITLAGETTRYNIIFLIKTDRGNITLSGNHPVSFRDFNLKAPTKLNGLIRVKEVLRVHLHLAMRAL